jgi:indolepyruvate ferredoxin oxidoreductase alpha subunit
MKTLVLLGDEAVALGALDAGMSGCYAYPGTPSTEIMEYVQSSAAAKERGVHREWSANEKTAMEEALGMSYTGKRSMVCMKHVGLNVAADGFVNSAITGANGGLVVTVADDPSMHSSQNEQDSRFYAKFAKIPCLEPSSQQEAYDMMAYAMELSEEFKVPVMLRLTTRLSHSRANVTRAETQAEKPLRSPESARRFILLPAIARRNYAELLGKQKDFQARSETSPFNRYIDGPDKSLGIITTGIAYNYLMEAYAGGACPHPVLKISQYPLPPQALKLLLGECKRVLVLEEGAPVVEEMLHGPVELNEKVIGRMTGALPVDGELNPDLVAKALGLDLRPVTKASEQVQIRPPRLCDGCPHIDSYLALIEAMPQDGTGRVFADIGCYTLGALPPFEAIHSCVDMGASISMAKGASDAGMQPAVAVIGDSTFTHSGMTPLLDAVYEKSPITVLLVDNGTTGMTGGQTSMAAGRMEEIIAGIGVEPEHLHIVTPLKKNHDENVRILREELAYQGVSVVIARRECIQTARRKKKTC